MPYGRYRSRTPVPLLVASRCRESDASVGGIGLAPRLTRFTADSNYAGKIHTRVGVTKFYRYRNFTGTGHTTTQPGPCRRPVAVREQVDLRAVFAVGLVSPRRAGILLQQKRSSALRPDGPPRKADAHLEHLAGQVRALAASRSPRVAALMATSAAVKTNAETGRTWNHCVCHARPATHMASTAAQVETRLDSHMMAAPRPVNATEDVVHQNRSSVNTHSSRTHTLALTRACSVFAAVS